MEWTKPLSVVVVAFVAVLALAATVELGRTTLADANYAVVSALALAFLTAVVAGMVGVGARGRQWLDNPDSYW